MISAGNYQTPTQYPPQTGVPPVGQGYGTGGGLAGPSFQPVIPQQQNMMPQGTNVNLEWSPDADSEFMEQYMWGQFGLQAGGMLNGVASMIATSVISNNAMEYQADIAMAYYDTQNHIADNQMEVALRQLGVQEQAIDAQRDMHGAQTKHELKIKELEKNAEVRIAAILESGKNERAKILSTDAFNRRGWDMGSPSIAA